MIKAVVCLPRLSDAEIAADLARQKKRAELLGVPKGYRIARFGEESPTPLVVDGFHLEALYAKLAPGEFLTFDASPDAPGPMKDRDTFVQCARDLGLRDVVDRVTRALPVLRGLVDKNQNKETGDGSFMDVDWGVSLRLVLALEALKEAVDGAECGLRGMK